MPKLRNLLQSILIFAIFIFILSVSGIVRLYTDYLWFDALGFSKIFTISLTSKIFLFSVSALFFFIFATINLKIASRIKSSKLPFKIGSLAILLVSLFQGFSASSAWLTFLQYLNQVPFNLKDPILAKDAAFYVFTLPFFLVLWNFLFASVLITALIVVLYYIQQFIASIFTPKGDPSTNTDYKPFNFMNEFSKLKRAALIHMAILASLIFFLLAAKHYLARFSVMYSEKGIVVGAGYTDVMVFLPVVKFLMILAVIIAVLFYIWIFYFSKVPKLRKRHILLFVLVLYLLFGIVGEVIIPEIVQSLKVSPNEINLEGPYIENNIKFTRIAYGLDEVEEKDFEVKQNLNSAVLKKASETIDNVRILDWRPLTTTYKQTQEIRLYYDLAGIDIDRYDIGGKYTQVMLAPRELDQNQITENAKTWVNLHEVYTHGFGVVMSPVNKVTKQGLPDYFIQDIPPIYAVENEALFIDQPRIYYGEKENDFVLVNTKTKEFDFPKGNTNEYITYHGTRGIKLDSFMKKILMAIRFADIKILLSSDVTSESKIMFQRKIQDRISKITPFLALDNDPYLVIGDGKLYWIQDAYTVTGNFPYSQKFGEINYIRNSVKVVVDAYNGDVTYYIVDKNDPLMKVYATIFPKQFEQFNDMPDSLKEHIRYPEDMFKIQSEIFSTYHMDDIKVFYNKEDAWQIPHEVYGTGQQITVEPYYIILKLPDEKKEEFVLMTTFTPIKKDNMVAWLAARSDGDDYGKLLLYKFPKDKLVYGPLQIEARIDQDSEISQQLTLWSQQGSRVTRGNLLVIPVENSLLYIEPLYIQAETGQLPELKRVLVSDGDRVVMEIDLETALKSLFGSVSKKTTGVETIDESQEDLIKEANNYYSAILDAMDKGDWSAFGENFDELGKIIGSLEKNS